MEERVWHKHHDPGVPTTIEIPDIVLHTFLEEPARAYPDRACTIFKGAVISYREMNQLSDRLAAGLALRLRSGQAGRGLEKGDRVAIFMPNSPQFVIAFFGILKAGGVVVATNPLPDEGLPQHAH